MMNPSAKVAEIFTTAGKAFTRLGELTIDLQTATDETTSGKWTDREIDMLHSAILRFSMDLNKLSESIKNRTIQQIRQTLKKKAFEDAGIPAKQVPLHQVQTVKASAPYQPQVYKSQIICGQHNFSSTMPQTRMLNIPTIQQNATQDIDSPEKKLILRPRTSILNFDQYEPQQQKGVESATSSAAVTSNIGPTITENIVIQSAVLATRSPPQILVSASSLSDLPPTIAQEAAQHEDGPADASMTLNRLNMLDRDLEGVECLRNDNKLDFSAEEIVGEVEM